MNGKNTDPCPVIIIDNGDGTNLAIHDLCPEPVPSMPILFIIVTCVAILTLTIKYKLSG